MEAKKVELKQQLKTQEVINYLNDLVKSFEAGTVVVEQADECISMILPEMVDVKIGAKHKKGKAKFSLALSWSTLSPESSETSEPIKISSKIPVEKEETVIPEKANNLTGTEILTDV